MGEQATLGDLILFLETMNPDSVVKYGFGSPHSDRGNYYELAFNPVDSTTVGEMITHAKSALNKDFEGYKGGTYHMDENTLVNIGYDSECGIPITVYTFRYWLVIARG